MARLFRKHSHTALKEELRHRLSPRRLARIRTRRQYDGWFSRVVGSACWRDYSRNGLTVDRWAYFAKLLNILVYEIVANRELFSDRDWKRLQSFLHVPIDATVLRHLVKLDPEFLAPRKLKGMSSQSYWAIQNAARELARKHGVPPIWFEVYGAEGEQGDP